MGTSFGGVGVLTAAGHFDEGEQRFIDGVIAENPISSKYAFVREIAHSTGGFTYILPGFMRELLAWCICLVMTWRRGSYSIPDPIQVVDKISPRPLLITHGEADSLVPFEHGMILYEAATRGPKDFLGVPNCDHCMVQNVDPVGWYRTTSSVIESVLKESSTEESRKCL
jgi:pimeloyl-ACP methyl ester carboxylesterase